MIQVSISLKSKIKTVLRNCLSSEHEMTCESVDSLRANVEACTKEIQKLKLKVNELNSRLEDFPGKQPTNDMKTRREN